MRRYVGIRLMRRWGLRLAQLCALCLVGLALMNMALPAASATHPHTVHFTPLVNTAATPTAAASPATPALTATPTTTHAKSAAPASGAPSWLGEGILVGVLILLGFALILVPVVLRSARLERRTRLAYPLMPLPQEKLVSQLSQVAPERKAPLSREQMQALHEAAQGRVSTSRSLTMPLASRRLINGLPASLPIAEAVAVPQLPAPRQTIGPRVAEDSMLEAEAAPVD